MHIVLNWLVQGAVLALISVAGLRLMPPSRASARYSFLWAAYLSLLGLPAVSALTPLTGLGTSLAVVSAVAAPRVSIAADWWTSGTVAAALWIAWFGVHAVLLRRDLVASGKATRGMGCPCDLLAGLPYWSRLSVTGRKTRVVLSDVVRAAGVLGCGTPVIAVAPRLVEQLGPADLDRVLVHEWAHVQRRDDLAHVVQRLVRAVVGWHPAAWWLDRQLALEREMACDEIAVRVTGSAKEYAQCLVRLAALRLQPERPEPGLAAVSPPQLQQRVERLRAIPCARPLRGLAIGSVLGLVTCALAIGSAQVVTAGAGPVVVITTVAAEAHAADVVLPSTRAALERLEPVRPAAQRGELRGREVRFASRGTVVTETSEKNPQIREPQTTAIAGVSVPVLAEPPSTPSFEFVASTPTAPDDVTTLAALPIPLVHSPLETTAGWMRPADIGVTIGRASQTAGVATAGFFRRFAKRVADTF